MGEMAYKASFVPKKHVWWEKYEKGMKPKTEWGMGISILEFLW